jgi:uncharacterized protein (TIGR02996 family)
MNEEEAFIRAIVDGPGDDLSRLVYADWLDDRDDPRGAYLRAECEAVETGEIAQLRELAAGLDPVWVARVSMPPVGACITHTVLSNRGSSVSAAEIAKTEQRIGVRFPADYKAFLLNYNGGYIDESCYFDTPDGPRTICECGWRLYSVDRVGPFVLRPDDVLPVDPPEHWEMPPSTEFVESWVSRFIVIGRDPDLIGGIFLGVSGADSGHVRILDTSVELEIGVRYNVGRPPYTVSFAEFLERLPGWLPEQPLSSGDETDDQEIPF